MKIQDIMLPPNQNLDRIEKPKVKDQTTDPQKEVAQEFESLFMEILLKSMRSTVPKGSEDSAKEMYESLLDSEYAKLMSKSSQLGIEESLLDWMKKNNP
jgi:flagellar protein FlgJ